MSDLIIVTQLVSGKIDLDLGTTSPTLSRVPWEESAPWGLPGSYRELLLLCILVWAGPGAVIETRACAAQLQISGGRVQTAPFPAFSSLLSLAPSAASPKERRSDMAHHPTFRKIYCDAVPYLFKKVRRSPRPWVHAPPQDSGSFQGCPFPSPLPCQRRAPPSLSWAGPDSPAVPFLEGSGRVHGRRLVRGGDETGGY